MVMQNASPVVQGDSGELVVRLNGGWTAVLLDGDEGTVIIQHGKALVAETGHIVDLHDPRLSVNPDYTLVCRGMYLKPDGSVETGEYGLVVSGYLPQGRTLFEFAEVDFNRFVKVFNSQVR
jgi:hypothetical protein